MEVAWEKIAIIIVVLAFLYFIGRIIIKNVLGIVIR